MIRYVTAVGLALVIALVLRVYSGYAATVGAQATQRGDELSLGLQVFLSTGVFISRWYVLLVTVLLVVALAAAAWVGAARERPGA